MNKEVKEQEYKVEVVEEQKEEKVEVKEQEQNSIPENFCSIINDFTKDLLNTFPECSSSIELLWFNENSSVEDKNVKTEMVFNHCLKIYPERFFDILNKNEDIFKTDSTVSTEFLPYIIFKHLWKCEITEKTKDSIWKYLQLILFSIINSVKDYSSFGDTANMFNSIDKSEFKNKLQDTLNTFTESNVTNSTDTNASNTSLPSADDIHSHMNGMLNGKLGDLAKEIAEETAGSLDIDFENITGVQDIFQSLFKNPTKLMNIVKNVGDKLDSRIKSGDLNQAELMSEATEMMSKMKNMPGLENMQEMLTKMGMGGMMDAMANANARPTAKPSAKPNKSKVPIKQENHIKKKLDLKQIQETQQKLTQQHEEDLRLHNILNDEQIISMFNDKKGDKSKKKKDKKE